MVAFSKPKWTEEKPRHGWMEKRPARHVGGGTVGGGLAGGHSAQATPIDFTSANPNLVTNPTSISQTVNGITVTAQAFTTEIQGGTGTIFGPFPTGLGANREQVFGTHTSSNNNPGLGLTSQPLPGINVGGSDIGGAGLAPAFDNYSRTPNAPPSFEFALFSFSAPVDVSSVTVNPSSNYDDNVWVAYGSSALNLSQDFQSAFSGYTFGVEYNSRPSTVFTAALSGADDISYLAVGALPLGTAFGPLPANHDPGFVGPGVEGFYIDGLDATATASSGGAGSGSGSGSGGGSGSGSTGGTGPGGPTPVPEPSSLALLAAGLASLGIRSRRRTRRAA